MADQTGAMKPSVTFTLVCSESGEDLGLLRRWDLEGVERS